MAAHWGYALIGIFFWLVVLAALIAVVVVAIRLISGPGRMVPPPGYPVPPAARETPLDILARRFASGEITAEEYQKARDLLQQQK